MENEFNHQYVDINDGEGSIKLEEKFILNNTSINDYKPIQQNENLFKMILYSTKVEIKLNSLINMIYTNSIVDISLWIISLILFIFSFETFFLAWALCLHLAKGIFGFLVLHLMPKTYEVLEKLTNEKFEESETHLKIEAELKDHFVKRWESEKPILITYFVFNIIAIPLDLFVLIFHCVTSKSWESEYNSIMIVITGLLFSKNFI